VKDDAAARERIERFVRENWTAFAGFAWRGFKKQGRGGILVDWASVEKWERDEAVTLVPHYVTYTEVARFAQIVETYDPEREIVMAVLNSDTETRDTPGSAGGPAMRFIRADASFRVWSFGGDPPPPQAVVSAAN
jgi:hypothetical protein